MNGLGQVVGSALVASVLGTLFTQAPAPVPEPMPVPPAVGVQPLQPQLLTAPRQSTQPRSLTLSLSLSAPEDLQVQVGDAVAAGQVIADRARHRSKLEARRSKAVIALAKMQARQIITPHPPAPVPEILPLPPPNLAAEQARIGAVEADIELQRRKLDLLQTLPPDQVPPAMGEHENRVLEELHQDLARAEGALSAAQAQRQYQEYEYSQAVAHRAAQANQQQLAYQEQRQRAAQRQRDQAFQVAQLEANLQAIEDQLSALSSVESPYAGTIRRIKWLGQSDNKLKVEVTLAVAVGGDGGGAGGDGRE